MSAVLGSRGRRSPGAVDASARSGAAAAEGSCRRGATALPTPTRRARLVLGLLVVATLATALVSLTVGAYPLSLSELFRVLARRSDDTIAVHVLVDLRLPRALLAVLVGAALAMGGAALQGLFRNPLADPGLIGVSAGAALAAVAVIVLGGSVLSGWVAVTGVWALPIAAFLGAAFTTWLVFRVATRSGITPVATLLLAGIAINALAGAATGVLIYLADDQQLRTLTFWSMGSLARGEWPQLAMAFSMFGVAVVLLPRAAGGLNAMLLGENVCTHLGYDLKRLKVLIVVAVAAMVGSAVALAGTIGFIGLVVPHLLRMVIGADHRYLLPASALGGALLLLLADMAARTMVAPAELPIGLLTALLGGPFFLWMLLRMRGRLA